MSISTPFIGRPVGTTLLTIAIALAGMVAYFFLPVSPLPQVDYPSVSVSATLPGASPETMASSVATPLERQFGRIAGVTEMTSSSSLGATNITMVFDLNRDIDAAARDVQAAINAAAGQLPANLPSKPSYRKINPADAPIMILSLTSEIYDKPRMYDLASSILQQKLAQVQGVGQVNVGGGSLPAVRVEVNPTKLNGLGLNLEDVRTTLANANANRPKGEIAGRDRSISIDATDQLLKADQYRPLIVAFRNGSPVRLGNIATVSDSVEDIRQAGLANGKPAILLVIFRQPGANIIATVDRIRELIPQLQASIPPAMKLGIGLDRTVTIRASVRDVEITLGLSIGLVILVVFVFLRSAHATLIPSVAVPISLIGTFAAMYLLDYSLDNLSLMALTIATGFVVDDAIVVVENISRHLEEGMAPVAAAIRGAREIGFTVMSISISLVAVFIPILLMGGYVGRLFREFAVTLSIAIGVSMIVSLTTTPMMCALLLTPPRNAQHGFVYRINERFFDAIHRFYERTLAWVLRHAVLMLLVTVATIGFTVYLYIIVPKGLFPQQDTGRLSGSIKADQNTSFQAMNKLLSEFAGEVGRDPNISDVLAFTGGSRGTGNTANMFATLRPIGERKLPVDQVIAELRGRLAHIPGATLFFQPVQDIRIGGRGSSSQYQYTLQGDDFKELATWAPKLVAKLRTMQADGIVDVDSDQQNRGLEASLVYDRQTAARFAVTPATIDSILYDAFGQRQVSTIYRQLNQYHVVMEAEPSFWQDPSGLKYIYLPTSSGTRVPLNAVAHFAADTTSLAVNHSGQFPSITVSFNLLPGVSLGNAVVAIENAAREIGLPASIHGNFAGTAQAFQQSLKSEPILIAAALAAVYIVLGVLYESFMHPITILSTLPSAGVGALLALLLTHTDLSVIALIGIILLIGIVKKNAIMMIDFALEAERSQGKTPRDAIFQACLLRFRPITMTTMAALLGGLPLALGRGTGAELRRPLGIAIVGGLIFSQMLTLYTTPVVYLYLDRLRLWLSSRRRHRATTSPTPLRPPRIALPILVLACAALSLISSSCTVGPDYKRPDQFMPASFKSATTQETATTQPTFERDWWRLFDDQTLDSLEDTAQQANTNLQAAMARVEQARAVARIAQSDFYPVITLDPSIQRARTPSNAPGTFSSSTTQPAGSSGQSGHTTTVVRIPFDLTYEVDLWGKIRRSVESARASERASEDDLQVVLQTLQADVATNYFNYRSLAAQEQILARTVDSYRRQVALTEKAVNAGVGAPTDEAQAEAQLSATISQQLDLQRQRIDAEHAIAILLGRPPSELNLAPRPLDLAVPAVPAGLPADLLRRRPDIAEAEQNLIAANAQVGVAKALFFPSLQLTGSAGFESFDVQHALDWEQRAWSIAAGLTAPIFEGGRLTANLEQVKARYEELNANYRGAVLTAIRDVEDSLTDLHLRSEQATAQAAAVEASQRYLRFSQLQYRQGLISYLQVIDAERTLLSNELQAAQILNQRLASTVLLIKAMGGGWEGD